MLDCIVLGPSENAATPPLAVVLAALDAAGLGEGGAGGSLEHLAHALSRLGRALDVAGGADALADLLSLGWLAMARRRRASAHLFRRHGLLAGLVQLLDGLGIESEILLAAHQDDGQAGAEVQHLGDPLREVSRCGGGRARRTFSCTLSRESGESMAKQMRMTCESG
jgi:hypothetical protein